MKILFTSDLHLDLRNYGRVNPLTGVHSTVEKLVKEFNDTLDRAIKSDVDIWVICGDVTHTKTPDNYVREAFAKVIQRARVASIKVYVLLGNHDKLTVKGKRSNFADLVAMNIPGLHVIEEATKFIDHGLQMIFIPWEKDVTSIVQKIRDQIKVIDEDSPAILIGHFTVNGSELGSERAFILGPEGTVPISELVSDKVQRVFLGHIHKRQVFEKGKIRYCGSMDRIDFGERNESKGSTLLDINVKTKETKVTFVEGTPRELTQFNFDSIEEANKFFDSTKQPSGGIFKIKVKCLDQDKRKLNLEQMYKFLKNADYICPPKFEIEKLEEERKQNKELTQELSLSDALGIWLKAQELSDDLKKAVKREAVRLMSEEMI